MSDHIKVYTYLGDDENFRMFCRRCRTNQEATYSKRPADTMRKLDRFEAKHRNCKEVQP